MLAEEPAAEVDRRLRDVRRPKVGPAVLAVVLPFEVVMPADRAEHRSSLALARKPPQSTVQVSPLSSAFARSPSPDAAVADAICSSISWSWVGRGTARSTPTGTGKSGQNIRDSISARYGSS